jgi:heme exporter protein D
MNFMVRLRLIFAIFWALVAAGFFLIGDERFQLNLGGVSFSSAWLAVVLAVYNLVRWWSTRSSLVQQRAIAEEQERRERQRREIARAERGEPPDPNFNFGPETRPENRP